MIKRLALALLAVLAVSSRAVADDAGDVDPAIAPFIDNSTLAVARIDPSRIDPAAAIAWWEKLAAPGSAGDAGKSGAQAALETNAAEKWLADYTAAGGSVAYGVAFMGNPQEMPAVLVIPLGSSAQIDTLESLLVNGAPGGESSRIFNPNDPEHGIEAIVLHDAIVFGMTKQVESMRLAQSVDRPIFARALAAAGDAPIKLAFVPSPVLELLADQALPSDLPPQLGAGPTSTLVHGLSYLAVGLSSPPSEAADAIIQCKDALSAQAYARAAKAALDTLSQDPSARKNIPNLDALVAALSPSLADTALTVHLDTPTIERTVAPALSNMLVQSRKQAVAVQTMSQIRQLCLATIEYEMDHQGQFPDSVDNIATYVGGADKLHMLTSSPRNPDAQPGIVYVKPAAKPNAPDQAQFVILFYEVPLPGADQVVAGYLDGHCATMPKADFDKALKSQAAPAANP